MSASPSDCLAVACERISVSILRRGLLREPAGKVAAVCANYTDFTEKKYFSSSESRRIRYTRVSFKTLSKQTKHDLNKVLLALGLPPSSLTAAEQSSARTEGSFLCREVRPGPLRLFQRIDKIRSKQ